MIKLISGEKVLLKLNRWIITRIAFITHLNHECEPAREESKKLAFWPAVKTNRCYHCGETVPDKVRIAMEMIK